jgi:exopolysaccharide biosynthesis predicted pyruvyltransferase EpsI
MRPTSWEITYTTEESKGATVDAGKKAGPEENTEETKYMLLPRYQNAGDNLYIKLENRYVVNVAKSKYLETAVKNRKLI